jgi:hypothetical protein
MDATLAGTATDELMAAHSATSADTASAVARVQQTLTVAARQQVAGGFQREREAALQIRLNARRAGGTDADENRSWVRPPQRWGINE